MEQQGPTPIYVDHQGSIGGGYNPMHHKEVPHHIDEQMITSESINIQAGSLRRVSAKYRVKTTGLPPGRLLVRTQTSGLVRRRKPFATYPALKLMGLAAMRPALTQSTHTIHASLISHLDRVQGLRRITDRLPMLLSERQCHRHTGTV